MNRLIVGAGTGRCGTHSLADLLNRQPGTDATHERYEHAVRWNCPKFLWPLRLWRDTVGSSQVKGPSSSPGVSADVALNWTAHAETFLRWADRDGRPLRIVVLKRDRDDVVASYMRHKPDADNWRFHGDSPEDPNIWDAAYPPEMEADTKREAIGMWWDRVHGILEPLAREDERVEVFRTEALNTEEGVRRILGFCGYDSPNIETGIKVRFGDIPTAQPSGNA